MPSDHDWIDLGSVSDLSAEPLTLVEAKGAKICVSFDAGVFGAVGAVCIHRGGPLPEGQLIDGQIECPWHHWHYDRITGAAIGKPGGVARYDVEVRDGRVFAAPFSGAAVAVPAAPMTVQHPLERPIVRAPGPIRVVGISTTVMNHESPRTSTSERLLTVALDHAGAALGAETKLLKLNDLKFRNCEGITRRAPRRAPGPARLLRTTRLTKCSRCTRPSCSGRTSR
jgi:nitrite reductase/ring-hydroxylating ferredoxin subunit